ncbi:hypothetical protein GCM10017083_25110 [Thalassobaculum fulvum]|uniref:Uncharacterized protein n=1 Tax=Thalassobaculum fulvum TaxID=1633335 RepID=A0A918XSF8_9PROT|nr:hypothetical protein GCM10017083_25110 [Thalassobaculum fulvum]
MLLPAPDSPVIQNTVPGEGGVSPAIGTGSMWGLPSFRFASPNDGRRKAKRNGSQLSGTEPAQFQNRFDSKNIRVDCNAIVIGMKCRRPARRRSTAGEPGGSG